MSNMDDPFHLETGLKDDYDADIIDAWFGTTENAGNTLFLFVKQLASDGEEVERRYSCGEDWQTFDGGQTAEHPKKQFFNTNSNLGLLIARAFSVGAEDELRKRSNELGGVGPRSAKLWIGFSFHWGVESEDIKLKDRDTGQMVERTVNRVLPTAFLGVKNVAQTSTTSQVSGTSGTTESTPPPQGSAPMADSPAGLQNATPAVAAQVKALAKANDYATWIDRVMQLPNVLNDDTLMAAISDESFYTALRDH